MNKIKFIYFDVGGVVIKDFSKTDKWEVMKKVMGVDKSFEKEFDKLYDKYEDEELCTTRDVDTLIPIFEKKFNMTFPPNFSMLQYFVDHFEENEFIGPVVKHIKQSCKVGLLTNQYVNMMDEIVKRKLINLSEWDKIIDSTKVNIRKPDPEIFELAEKLAGVKGREILFVDNGQKNVDAANNFGWQTFYYDSTNHQKACADLMKFINTNNS